MQLFKIKFFIMMVFLLVSEMGNSVVQVAFIEAYWPDGRVVEFGPGGRYFHVAIGIDGLWYDSFPNELVQGKQFLEFDESFTLGEVLENRAVDLTAKDMEPYLGLAFDKTFSWDKKGCTYCSKLVADVLGVPATRMDFEGKHWQGSEVYNKGGLGISPDELYEALISRGFVKVYDKVLGEIAYSSSEDEIKMGLQCRDIL